MKKIILLSFFLSSCDIVRNSNLDLKPVEQSKLEKSVTDKFDSNINLRDRMYLSYKKFLEDNIDQSDLDWDFISYKTNLIYEKGIINLTDPFIFGIIPNDMPAFLAIRDRIKALSDVNQGSTNLIYQNALTDLYVSFDCWLEGVESGTSQETSGYTIKKAKECRDQVLQKISIISGLINNVSSINDPNDKVFKKCETCRLAFSNINCNAFYFDKGTTINQQSDYVYKRIRQKIYLAENPDISLFYYTSPMFTKKYNKERIKIVLNMINNMLNELKVEKRLDVKIQQRKILTSETNLLFKDAITVCIKG